MKFNKKTKGISLIVLVITIIVIIILAAAVIISLQNNNPMIEANEARIKSDVANIQSIFTNAVGKIMAENQDVIEVKKGQLNTITSGKGINKTSGEATYTINDDNGNPIIEGKIKFENGSRDKTTYYTGRELPIYNDETIWYVDSQGLISVNIGGVQYGEGEQIDEKYQLVKGNAKEFIDADGDKAMIPINFAIVPGKEDVSNGLVISDVENDKDDIGNQYVWVPVNNMSTFVREEGYNKKALQDILSSTSEPLTGLSESLEEVQEYNKMIASVREYHGFYIGRYEVSEENGNLQSKKNKDVRRGKTWNNAVNNIRSIYPENNSQTGEVVSTLVYGVCWDETVRFIKKNYSGIEIYSDEYGNYASNKGVKTGSKDEYALNNIYDMAGNYDEWTMEAVDNTNRILRGGGIYNLTSSISSRKSESIGMSSGGNSSRIQLYIKL